MADLILQNTERALTSAEFQNLAEVPPELEWFANISAEKTRKVVSAQRSHLFVQIKTAYPDYFWKG